MRSGEKQELIFCPDDLRHSEEWLGNRWTHMQERQDIATSILSRSAKGSLPVATLSTPGAISDSKQPGKDRCQSSKPRPNSKYIDKAKESHAVPDLSKDGLLAKLRWTRSKKRSQPSSSSWLSNKSSPSLSTSSSHCERFLISSSMKMDHDNCKYLLGDSLFTSSVVPPLSSMVMSR